MRRKEREKDSWWDLLQPPTQAKGGSIAARFCLVKKNEAS